VHATFVLLLMWVAWSHVLHGRGLAQAAAGVGLILSMFACVVVHELSHAVMAKRFGIRTRDITLLPIGGVARLEKMPEKPTSELLVALAGPVTSLAIAGVLFVILAALGHPRRLADLEMVGGPFLAKLMWINLVLAVFNLVPAFPMDGGRVLRAAIALRTDRGRATEIAARIGQALALVMGLVGLFFGSIYLAIIAAFIWIGARGEASFEQIKAALSDLTVSQAMISDFRVLGPRDPLARAAEVTLTGFQRDFPVMDGNRLVGVLTQADLLRELARTGAETPVEVAMQRRFQTVGPAEVLDVAFDKLQRCECRALIVVQDDKIVGLLTPENLGEMLTIEEALRAFHASGAAGAGHGAGRAARF
jgi:Zn-dependent protease/predicted transcriptional regulator